MRRSNSTIIEVQHIRGGLNLDVRETGVQIALEIR